MSESIFRMPVRYYQTARLYGPGMPPSGTEGFHEHMLEKPAGQVGLVLVHCWNLGEPGGPYPVPADAEPTGEAADWVLEARDIMRDKIAPALEAAREAGVAVFHLAQHTYAARYASFREIGDDPDLEPRINQLPFERCVRPRSIPEQWQHEYGEEFPGPVWLTHKDQFDIARPVRPLDSELVVLDGWQLNGLCRRRDIDTLFYVGFMADLCLVNVPGAIREMSSKFGYRCVVLRDCTTAYEFADTREHGCMARAAIRLIETGLGYSAVSDDFIAACCQAR